jgi:hypothetical protein
MVEFPKNKNKNQFMQFALKVTLLECFFVKHRDFRG